jgi:hypothetical protein
MCFSSAESRGVLFASVEAAARGSAAEKDREGEGAEADGGSSTSASLLCGVDLMRGIQLLGKKREERRRSGRRKGEREEEQLTVN